MNLNGKRILLGVSGSIAAYKAAEICSRLSKLDADAPINLALATDNGKIFPLVKDAGSRMFYQDKRLHNRPMRLTARLIAGYIVKNIQGPWVSVPRLSPMTAPRNNQTAGRRGRDRF